MRGLRILPVLAVILAATTFASVFASGYSPAVPLLGTSGAPALSGTQYTGVITVLYADGMPVVLSSHTVTLQLCTSSCIDQVVTLKQTAPGTYAYSFNPPATLTGTITINVIAGSLADDNGRIFPAVSTQIGTYATPGLSSSSSSSSDEARSALPANPVPQQSGTMREAVALPQPTQQSPAIVVLTVIIGLVASGAFLVLRRH